MFESKKSCKGLKSNLNLAKNIDFLLGVGPGVRGKSPGHINFTPSFAWEKGEHSRSKILVLEEDASNSQVKRASELAEDTSKGLGSHAFLELIKYNSGTMLHFNFTPPPFDMIVIDKDSRFTFKVDCKGKVGHTIINRTKFIKKAIYQEDQIVTEEVDYQKTNVHQQSEVSSCTHTKKARQLFTSQHNNKLN